MQLKIRARNAKISRTFEEWIERRLYFALAKFGGRISRITALLEDLNGPRGGVDQRCRVEVLLTPSARIAAEATDANAVVAVSRAADRIARRVRDALERQRSIRARTKAEVPEMPAPEFDVEGGEELQ